MTRMGRLATWALLAGAATALAVAPWAVGHGYDAVSQSISESAAQCTPHAWVGRVGLALLGAGSAPIAMLAWRRRRAGNRVTGVTLAVFAVGMVASAVWSHAPWLPGVPESGPEDVAHSVAASVAGMAITVATLSRGVQQIRSGERGAAATIACLIVVAVVPPLMGALPTVAGVLQRFMFATAIAWLAWDVRTAGKDD